MLGRETTHKIKGKTLWYLGKVQQGNKIQDRKGMRSARKEKKRGKKEKKRKVTPWPHPGRTTSQKQARIRSAMNRRQHQNPNQSAT